MIDTKERLAELLGYYMPPIDRNRCMPYLKGECNGLCAECTAKLLVDNGVTVTVDAVEVVRRKDCKHIPTELTGRCEER